MIFLVLLTLTIAVGSWMALQTREITFFSVGTNNEKQIRAAAQSDKWRWPSDMHDYTKDKARMKDAGVLGVACFQRLLKDRKTEYPLILLCNVSCSLAAVLLYLVAAHYWNERVGLLIFTLFLFSFWPHQITLQGTYQCLAMMFLLLSIYCLQQVLDMASGIAFGLMMFSSAAARKFLPMIVGAFFYHIWERPHWIESILYFGSGFTLTVLFFTLPHVIQNLKGYWNWWNNSKNACHFMLYRRYFEAIGKPVSEKMRGAGWKWVLLFFFKMAPFHSTAFLISTGLGFYVCFLKGFEPGFVWKTVSVLSLSLSPIFYGELTRAPQLGRSYFPGFVGFLLFIAYSVFHFEETLRPQTQTLFWTFVALFVFLCLFWNAWVFFGDILPARMAVTNLIRKLESLGIKKFYTYDTPFNDAFVHVIPEEIKRKFEIQSLRSLKDVQEGFVVIPGTSAKALNMECQEAGIRNEDYKEDPFLNELIQGRKIQHYSIASFKTFGTSKIWVHESEMPTYQALILKNITNQDRFRGYAWILDAKKLQEVT